jgi:hypothetical protein
MKPWWTPMWMWRWSHASRLLKQAKPLVLFSREQHQLVTKSDKNIVSTATIYVSDKKSSLNKSITITHTGIALLKYWVSTSMYHSETLENEANWQRQRWTTPRRTRSKVSWFVTVKLWNVKVLEIKNLWFYWLNLLAQNLWNKCFCQSLRICFF